MTLSKKQKAKVKQRNIGMAAQPPGQACSDAKCPWHGLLPVRGKVVTGNVVAARAAKTATVEWKYVYYLPKYQRYERRHSHVVVYNPDCIRAKAGDTVKIAECRPLGKTKSFVIIEKVGAVK